MSRTMAVARHALHSVLRSPFARTGAAIVPAVGAAGTVAARIQDGAWTYQGGILAMGAALGAIFVIRSGVVEHRTGGFQDFLRVNYITPVQHMAAAALSLLAVWALFVAWVFILGLALSGGDAGAAAWTAWLLLLRLGFLLPFVLMVELAADVKTPLVVPGAVWMAGIFVMALFVGAPEAVAIAGLDADAAFPWLSTRSLLLRTALSLGLGFGAVLLWTRMGAERERRRVRESAGS